MPIARHSVRGLTWGADNKDEEYQPLISSTSSPPARASTEVVTGTATAGGGGGAQGGDSLGSDRLASSFPSAVGVSFTNSPYSIYR